SLLPAILRAHGYSIPDGSWVARWEGRLLVLDLPLAAAFLAAGERDVIILEVSVLGAGLAPAGQGAEEEDTIAWGAEEVRAGEGEATSGGDLTGAAVAEQPLPRDQDALDPGSKEPAAGASASDLNLVHEAMGSGTLGVYRESAAEQAGPEGSTAADE